MRRDAERLAASCAAPARVAFSAAVRAGHPQKRAGLVQGLAQGLEPAVKTDEVEEIAVLARGGVAPLASRTFARTRAAQADVERASRRIPDIADGPIMAAAAASGEVMPTDPFGLFGQQAREFGSRGGEGGHGTPPSRRGF